MPSAQRLAAIGLAIAAIVIVALSVLALVELKREGELHRDVIDGMLAKDSIEALRIQLRDLTLASRLVALTGDAASAALIERRAVEVEAELAYLEQHPLTGDSPASFDRLKDAAHTLVLAARSIAPTRGKRDADPLELAARAERAGDEAMTALERTLEGRVNRINDRTLAQIRVVETLRSYVSWLFAGSVVVLMGLFATYRWAAFREREAQRRIEHLAHHDIVTGLPNRALLADLLERELARASRGESPFALVMFDLDGFKSVNDTWGHAAGDRVLVEVAQRARACVRASDTVGRLGGDEFLAILPETSREGASAVAEKLLAALARPYALGRTEAQLSASLGVALFPDHGTRGDPLQRAADAALYAAKREGKNRIRLARSGEAAAAEAPA